MTAEQPTLFITTPIYYVNDVPHVGHAYTTVAADTLARARRLAGQPVFFLTGTDEHGQNIERIAREKGVSEQTHCDRVAAAFEALWTRYDVRFDRFIRTTSELHKRGVLRLWERLSAARTPDGREAVYRGRYAGWYCPRCEGFKDEEELRQPGNVCPDHERPCEWTEEENFFFRLSAYGAWLREAIESDRLRIRPDSRRNEILGVIKQGLKDFSVSRARVKWGIPVPEQPDHVLYVWVDALSNYVTALGFGEEGAEREAFLKWWGEGPAATAARALGAQAGGVEAGRERLHLIGKDIIRFHCLYWPAILHAAGLPIPTREFAQGFITKEGRKLSKTTGNVIDPVALVEQLGPDAARYFLLREAPYGSDWDFTNAAFVNRYNADLANDLGNLVSRALTMAVKYCDGKVPARWNPAAAAGFGGAAPTAPPPVVAGDFTEAFASGATAAGGGNLLQRVLGQAPAPREQGHGYAALDFAGALSEIWSWIGQFNQAIVQVAPWVLAKDPSRRAELDAFLYRLLEGVRLVALVVSPVMPGAAARIFGMLGLGDLDRREREPGPEDLAWGRLSPGASLGTIAPLFPRVEKANASKETTVSEPMPPPAADSEGPAPAPTPAAAAATPAPATTPAPASAPAPPGGERIDIAEFARLDLRAAKVVAAEKISGSKKLLRLQVDLGGETRQVVAGIADSYDAASLVGRTVVLVANLKPAKLMGVESNGMVLAGSREGKAVLCSFEGDVVPGTKVK